MTECVVAAAAGHRDVRHHMHNETMHSRNTWSRRICVVTARACLKCAGCVCTLRVGGYTGTGGAYIAVRLLRLPA